MKAKREREGRCFVKFWDGVFNGNIHSLINLNLYQIGKGSAHLGED